MENQGTRSLEETFHTIGGINITVKRVMDLIVGAFEGGSNYWYLITNYEQSINPKERGTIPRCAFGGGYIEFCDKDEYYEHKSRNTINECQVWRLDEDAMKRGLALMVTKEYIHHFANFVQEKDDANTADIFLQLSLFGEIIYA